MNSSLKYSRLLKAAALLVPGVALVAWAALQVGFPEQRAAAPTRVATPAPTGTPARADAVPAVSAAATAPEQVGVGLASTQVVVNRNDTLDQIFRRLKIDLADLASLRNLPGLKSKLDRLYPGESLRFDYQAGALHGLERQLSPSETLRVRRQDSGFLADILENPLEKRVRTVRGVIDHSLFVAVTTAGAHDQTAMALADIFAWDIDFVLDIQRGDTFVVTYEEVMQDGRYIKDGPVLAARFVNQGREHTAVRYVDPNGQARYFSSDGRSVRKAFLRAPLEFTRVSSRFNLSRKHPILNRIRAHRGVDYAAPTGTPVRAAGDGRVRLAGRKGGYGNVVELQHSGGVITVYGHLSRFARGTRTGSRVEQGDVIAYVGMSGLATGPHLHYEYQINGVHKNPQTVILPDATPIDASLREDFAAATEPLLASLEPPLGPRLVAR